LGGRALRGDSEDERENGGKSLHMRFL